MVKSHQFSFIFGLFLIISAQIGIAQDTQEVKVIVPRTKASPFTMSTFMNEDNTYLKITYGQPYKKERAIFGGLVPYGKIWRTGANEATEFTTTKDIKVGKKTLKAGTYTLFTIPEEDKWTIIFNSVLGQWGAYKYDEVKENNVLDIKASVEVSKDMYEAFTILFEEERKGVNMLLLWDQTKIVIPITFSK